MAVRSAPMLALCVVALLCMGSASKRPDVVFEVDLSKSEMHIVARGVRGPSFKVATGTPQHPTPVGTFQVARWIGNPSFTPGPEARKRGAEPVPASENGPLGFAKMPFFESFQVHGGAHRYAVGMPNTLGCVQLTNDAMRKLNGWLAASGTLAKPVTSERGERVHAFVRPAVIRIH